MRGLPNVRETVYTKNDAITHGRLLISVNANGGPVQPWDGGAAEGVAIIIGRARPPRFLPPTRPCRTTAARTPRTPPPQRRRSQRRTLAALRPRYPVARTPTTKNRARRTQPKDGVCRRRRRRILSSYRIVVVKEVSSRHDNNVVYFFIFIVRRRRSLVITLCHRASIMITRHCCCSAGITVNDRFMIAKCHYYTNLPTVFTMLYCFCSFDVFISSATFVCIANVS